MRWRCVPKQSCPTHNRNSATAFLLGQSGILANSCIHGVLCKVNYSIWFLVMVPIRLPVFTSTYRQGLWIFTNLLRSSSPNEMICTSTILPVLNSVRRHDSIWKDWIAHKFLTAVLHGSMWSTWRAGRFTPCERLPVSSGQCQISKRYKEGASKHNTLLRCNVSQDRQHVSALYYKAIIRSDK